MLDQELVTPYPLMDPQGYVRPAFIMHSPRGLKGRGIANCAESAEILCDTCH